MRAMEFKKFKNVWISTKPVLPCVWMRREGGHVVRAKVTVEATGRVKEIFRVLPEADAPTALCWLEQERLRVRSGSEQAPTQRTRFSAFAASLFEHKVKAGDIKSAAGRNKWMYTLKHLIDDFGEFYIDAMRSSHIDAWRREKAELVAQGTFAPTTVNGWIGILRVIMKAARRQFGLAHDAMDGVEYLDTSEHETYTEEEPNSLEPSEVGPYVERFRALYPQHFAMMFLGMATGLRPSSLRPLRRRGANSDVSWEESRLRVRRSHTAGDEVMNTTKQKKKYGIDLPREVMDVLDWHVRTQLRTDAQRESDLLFPSISGGYRTPKVLLKPMVEVAIDLGLKKRVTPRALRRTFNDLARAARVNDVVTRSISGHLTDDMQRHYSTVNGSEQREAVAKVIRLFSAPPGEHAGEQSAARGEQKQTG